MFNQLESWQDKVDMMLLLRLLIDIDGADGGNIGCKYMSGGPNDEDRFTDLIVNGIHQLCHNYSSPPFCLSLCVGLHISR